MPEERAIAQFWSSRFQYGAVVLIDVEGGIRLALWPTRSLARDSGLTFAEDGTPRISLGHNVGSREEVDAVMKDARRAGGAIVKDPADTYGGYAGYFDDPDHYLWESRLEPAFVPDE
jgi:uncharacterized protein